MIPKFSKYRSKRLRKKLHVDEFQQMFFEVKFLHDKFCDVNEDLDRFIAFIESLDLSLFCCTSEQLISNAYISQSTIRSHNVKVTQQHLHQVIEWLTKNFTVIDYSQLKDAWYCDEY